MPTRLADGLGLESTLSFSEFAPKIGFPAFMPLHMNLGYNLIVESNYYISNSQVKEFLWL
jgi:hypothetical protein